MTTKLRPRRSHVAPAARYIHIESSGFMATTSAYPGVAHRVRLEGLQLMDERGHLSDADKRAVAEFVSRGVPLGRIDSPFLRQLVSERDL